MRINIRIRLFIWFLVVSVIPLAVMGGFSYYLILERISKHSEEALTNIGSDIYNMVDIQQKTVSNWLESSAAFVSQELSELGQSRIDPKQMTTVGSYELPTWYIGSQKITNDFTIVDKLLQDNSLGATFFQLQDNKFIRVSTNVRSANGARIIGTLLDPEGPIYKKVLNGQKFLGRANVEGVWWATLYIPFRDASGTMIGAFVLGRPEQGYELMRAIKNIVIEKTGYVFVLDSFGNVIIHPTMQGKNLGAEPWVQEIIRNKKGSITYTWEGREKLGYYVYYEPWDWYIVTGGYVSDIYSAVTTLKLVMALMALFTILLSSFIAYVLSDAFGTPIRELMVVMRQAQRGNLVARISSKFRDEFFILSNALQAMLGNIAILIGRIKSNSAELKEASKRLIVDLNDSKKSLQDIEKGVSSLQNMKESLGAEAPSAQLNGTELNNLKVEVATMKLLLKNITSSASSLDDIASSLDRHVKIFHIDGEGAETESSMPEDPAESMGKSIQSAEASKE